MSKCVPSNLADSGPLCDRFDVISENNPAPARLSAITQHHSARMKAARSFFSCSVKFLPRTRLKWNLAPGVETVVKLSEKFGKSADWILKGEG